MKKPTLYFSPYAWAKMVYIRDLGPTEVGFFGISDPEDPMTVADVLMVEQECTATFCKFTEEGIADFTYKASEELGLQPWQFSRIWIHTHPDNSAKPSGVDEETWKDTFMPYEWAIMFILAKDGSYTCRLKYTAVGRAIDESRECDAEIDYSIEFDGTDREAWKAEYEEYVTEQKVTRAIGFTGQQQQRWWRNNYYSAIQTGPHAIKSHGGVYSQISPDMLEDVFEKYKVSTVRELSGLQLAEIFRLRNIPSHALEKCQDYVLEQAAGAGDTGFLIDDDETPGIHSGFLYAD